MHEQYLSGGSVNPVEPHWANLRLEYLRLLIGRYKELSGQEPNLLIVGQRELTQLRRSCNSIITGTKTHIDDWKILGLSIVPIHRAQTGLVLANGIHANNLIEQNAL